MILAKLLESSREELHKNNIESYKIDSIALICHVLGLSKEEVIFQPELLLTQNQIQKVNDAIRRRINREPVSHIIGKREFYEDVFDVSAEVLDPRPDSEILIESILDIFPDKLAALEMIELGVGSGCLILTSLKKFPNANALAVDIREESLDVARINAKNLQLESRIKLIKSNWFGNIPQKKFDLIISNPPYIESLQIESLQEEVKIFEPRTALDGGLDGLDCYRNIAKDAVRFLKDEGYLVLEIGQGQENDVVKIFTNNKLNFINSRKDLGGIIRCLIFQK